ncbi:aminodeoxychorismate synthase component I [Agromyces sp. H66]|uniref:aminodeoxychorismate synthase component I n=1 Tax=Agromyces sp. H66 TaxID=2529859 RepID=UPI0010AB3393|nr:aminodeoxychorismate synthase component I [Agromyces sp. H66]
MPGGLAPDRPVIVPRASRDIALPDWVDPEVVFTRLFRDEATAFWLDGGFGATEGVSYIGVPSPTSVVAMPHEHGGVGLTSPAGDTRTRHPGSVFDLLRATTETTETTHDDAPASDDPPASGLRLGWVGWLGYELGAELVGTPHHRSALPDFALMYADRVIAFDHAERTITLRVPDGSPSADRWVDETTTAIDALRGREPAPPRPARRRAIATLRHPREEYLRMLAECADAIARGDAFQICLTNEITIDASLDPVETYLRLRRANPSHHAGLLRFGDVALLSSSPEQFLDIRPDGRVETMPIKGTRRRGTSEAEDAALIRELAADPKERAENIMIVDLMRNDLSRVAELGSVVVHGLLRVESYRNVHQLVSTVSARIAEGRSWVDVLEACLPAGSMTGTPKHSAMTIIDRLERGPRGPYAGAFGYLGTDGRVDLAMTIRSLVVQPEVATIGTGGGVTASSVDEHEFAETLLKAEPLLAAASATLVMNDIRSSGRSVRSPEMAATVMRVAG